MSKDGSLEPEGGGVLLIYFQIYLFLFYSVAEKFIVPLHIRTNPGDSYPSFLVLSNVIKPKQYL